MAESPQSQASPQSSSPPVSLGLVLIGFGATIAPAPFELEEEETAELVCFARAVLDRAGVLRADPAMGRLWLVWFGWLVFVEGLDRPLGNCDLDFASACALSQPSKSGSPPSSNGTIGAAVLSSDGASKNESSPMSPHASSISSLSSSSCPSLVGCSVEGLVRAGAADPISAFRWRVDAEEEEGEGRDEGATGGAEEARPSAGRLCVLDALGLACISPLAVAILFVNDEMAQPAHDVSFWVVPMRGAAPLVALVLGGGRIESGNEFAYFFTRCW